MIANMAEGVIDRKACLAGINIGLAPGVYRLRVETGSLGLYEIFLSTAKGWQTRAFLTCDDFYSGREKIRRPLLRTASVLMGRQRTPFDPACRDARLAEIALTALLRGYDILDSPEMKDILQGKFNDPMLGLYSAHLLLARPRIKWDLVNTVCHSLNRLVGPIPDVQALFMKARGSMPGNRQQIARYHGLPPMLIHSWDLLIEQSRSRYTTIPIGSLSDRISDTVVSTMPWLMSRVALIAEDRAETVPQISFAMADRVLANMTRQVLDAGHKEIESYLKEQEKRLDPIENAIFNAISTVNRSEDLIKTKDRDKAAEELQWTDDTRKAIRQLMTKLPAPTYSIARSALSLAEKLKDRLEFNPFEKGKEE
ncbi:hypothetical protein CSA57_14580 [candidate division KSB3 bacterium]|nr:MAG: hypothetical protein CSA57_14580 [candidate division KSB3 bacterium]